MLCLSHLLSVILWLRLQRYFRENIRTPFQYLFKRSFLECSGSNENIKRWRRAEPQLEWRSSVLQSVGLCNILYFIRFQHHFHEFRAKFLCWGRRSAFASNGLWKVCYIQYPKHGERFFEPFSQNNFPHLVHFCTSLVYQGVSKGK